MEIHAVPLQPQNVEESVSKYSTTAVPALPQLTGGEDIGGR
jgi:hypothetical protein